MAGAAADPRALRSSESVTREELQRLQQVACAALANAYAPYSKLRVGAAALMGSGEIYSGCNVENASYGLTVCAERVAIFTSVSKEGVGATVRALAVCCDVRIASPPCGACRQVLSEFGRDAVVTYWAGESWIDTTCSELLPKTFSLDL